MPRLSHGNKKNNAPAFQNVEKATLECGRVLVWFWSGFRLGLAVVPVPGAGTCPPGACTVARGAALTARREHARERGKYKPCRACLRAAIWLPGCGTKCNTGPARGLTARAVSKAPRNTKAPAGRDRPPDGHRQGKERLHGRGHIRGHPEQFRTAQKPPDGQGAGKRKDPATRRV